MMNKREKALDLFSLGYNCAQSVLLAFCEDFGLPKEKAAQLSLSFGGGMGIKEACGALTGAFMVLGLAFPAHVPPLPQEKAGCYAQLPSFADAFRQHFGALRCGDLLTRNGGDKSCCKDFVGTAAELLEQFLQNETQSERS